MENSLDDWLSIGEQGNKPCSYTETTWQIEWLNPYAHNRLDESQKHHTDLKKSVSKDCTLCDYICMMFSKWLTSVVMGNKSEIGMGRGYERRAWGSFYFVLFYFVFLIVVQVQLSPFSPHHGPQPTHPRLPPSNLPPLALSMCPIYMFLDGPSPSPPVIPLEGVFRCDVTVCILFGVVVVTWSVRVFKFVVLYSKRKSQFPCVMIF